jgi:enterochelin esterase-like enzyme
LGVVALAIMPLDPSPTQPGWDAPAAQAAPSGRRAANAFGTPIPRGAGAPAPPGFRSAQPLPEPRRAPSARSATGTNVLPEYVGPIRGRFTEQVFYTRALGRDMSYFVYLPPDYDAAGRSYPVLYLLHGASGQAEEWPAYGFIDTLDRAITAHDIEPFIVVLPEGEWGYWINHADGGERWGDYVTRDLVTHVDNTYRTLRRSYRRAIGGLSMGGSGALVQAFTYPEVFGAVAAHSPSLREDNEVVPILGEGAEFAARDPVSLARRAPAIDQLQIWIDIGEDDPWHPRALQLHGALVERSIDHDFHEWPGDHDGEYWTSHIPDYLRFYSHAITNR